MALRDRQRTAPPWGPQAIDLRTDAVARSVRETIRACSDLEGVTQLFLRWMNEGTIVRVLGAGRARLAAALPASRLAHGGARVFVQDDMVPMPSSLQGGGVIAASASGRNRTLLKTLSKLRQRAPQVEIVGIASADADEFRRSCHHFIGIRDARSDGVALTALTDIPEHVISQVLDALVVAAGKLGGFDDGRWRLGHEDIGNAGPYDLDDEST